MKLFVAPILALIIATPAVAQEAQAPTLNLEQRMLLRCSAAFALVANRQQSGEAWALEYPPLAESGQEFFVVASARVMDQAQITSQQIASLLQDEAQELLDQQLLPDIMPVCLRLLEQPGQ